MPKIHELKIWPDYFRAVENGTKTFEIRREDRDFEVGDFLFLREYDPLVGIYMSGRLAVEVTAVFRDFPMLDKGYCAMSIKPHRAFKVFEMQNPYQIDGDVTYIYLSTGERAIIDTEDLQKVKPYRGTFFKQRTKYAGGVTYRVAIHHLDDDANRKREVLGRIVTGSNKMYVRHKNENYLDCRKTNLYELDGPGGWLH